MRSLLIRARDAAFTRRAVEFADPADVAFVTGCALVALGAAAVFVPAGLIIGGVLLAWIGWRAGK